jgi:DNA-binding response OmpR family regulator
MTGADLSDREEGMRTAVLESGLADQPNGGGRSELVDRAGRARIVVVDDDDDLRGLVAARLTRAGYDVREAPTGLELMHAVNAVGASDSAFKKLDLVIIDNQMPGLTGIETIRRLRATNWNTPSILMTAFPGLALEREAVSLGLRVLAKPFSHALLTQAVVETLGERERPSKSGTSR